MTIEEFKAACNPIPELFELWNALADIALNTQTRGLPLALRVYQAEQLSEEEHRAYHTQQQEFQSVAEDLARACARYNVAVPELRVGEICALFQ